MLKQLVFISCLIYANAGSKPNYETTKSTRSLDNKQKLTCYERAGNQGDAVILTDYAPYLDNYNFNNRAASCCFEGIWLLYDGENYNTNNPSLTTFNGWGEGYCVDFDNSFSQTASSARFTGPPDGYKYSTINFYKYDSYSGDEQYLYDSAANLNIDNFGSSIVVTGCDAWTIYQYDNYGGNSLCLYPSDTSNCYPSFFRQSDLGQFADQTSSARKGCYSKNIVKADIEYTMRTKIA